MTGPARRLQHWGASSFAILGPGGVGGFLAAALCRAGDQVTVIARARTTKLIKRDGISVESVLLGEFVARPDARAVLDAPVDVLFVATKATGLADALTRIKVAPELVVPLLNGLDHVALLRERFGAGRVCAGTIRIDSDRPSPGRIVHKSTLLLIEVAAEDRAVAVKLPPLIALLNGAEVPARIGSTEKQVMWSKLVRLNALASTTSVSGKTIGLIRSDPEWRAALAACIEESAAVANADGASIDAAVALSELDAAHATLGSSMQRDLEAGRTPELDAIQGSVLRAAARLELQCPTIARLSAQIAARAGIPAPS
ncbi:MAG: ketopantoate reductase family protein [Solirubrobacteraceae bacterium]